jgi:hypothetical protein
MSKVVTIVEQVPNDVIEIREGVRGEKGNKGDKGDKGLKGDKGEQGLKGDQGEKGDTGLKGDKGEAGYTPVKGVDYFDGEKGDKGDKGDQGEQGPAGISNLDRVLLTPPITVTEKGRYLIAGNGNVTLPNPTSLPEGQSFDFTVAVGFEPQLVTVTGGIKTKIGLTDVLIMDLSGAELVTNNGKYEV